MLCPISVAKGGNVHSTKILKLDHLHSILSIHRANYFASTDASERYTNIASGCVALAGFLCWLRANECFSLRLGDLQLVPPGAESFQSLKSLN